MNQRDALLRETEELLRLIERAWQADLGSSACWFGAEGEDVLGHARDFLGALREGTQRDLLRGGPLAEYLGRSWIDSHATVHRQVGVLAGMLGEAV